MRFTRASRNRLFVAECETDLAEQANVLLELVAEADAEGEGLKDGSVTEFGWAPLKLRAEGRHLVLCEPDYKGDVNEFVPFVSHTLRVLLDQATILNGVGVSGVAAKYDQAVVFKSEVFKNERVYLHRRIPVDVQDSGWYIGPADDLLPPGDKDLDALRVYQLLDLAPAFLKVMALPQNYLVVFNKDEIEAVFDDHGKLRSIPAQPLGART